MTTNASRAHLDQLIESLRYYVTSLKESGVEGLPHRDSSVPQQEKTPSTTASSISSPEQTSLTQVVATVQPRSQDRSVIREEMSMPTASAGDLFVANALQGVQTLEALRDEIGDCHRCKLCKGRTQIVYGVGNPKAELVFVGEGPGRDEDIKGEPFVGRAGQLLTEIITKGMKMRREDVYIANVVKCRPPENRNPEPDEIAACEPFLVKQLEIIKPRFIVALGTFAAQTLLKTKTPISRLRGNWHTYQGIQLMPTLHPAYLLRNPQDKRLVWQDIQAVLRAMGRL